ncbi:hypothetical protein [Laspinema olomoucense]|uniref:Tripartite tricarboxylate transporter TctB family protein n=1 Tax=Laspinema olomoucense D3b TaxID=2953688 RepID=A0ABT2N2J2_9CYAN|nr:MULTISPECIES: hypothetical protein [unclassified Laspinema]MCT7976893.1 hypothetical protein [Laspinema sp. D3b]MCT7989529.1 hypothetical protein [Laspinema sp. D3a]
MFFIKALPRLSLLLLAGTYCNFGWTLATAESPWWVWVLSIVFIFLMAEALAAPWSIIRTISVRWLKSDYRTFFTVLLGAFFLVVFLSWLDISAYGLALLVSAAIARLDLQTGPFRPWQDFLILFVVATLGLSLGWALSLIF